MALCEYQAVEEADKGAHRLPTDPRHRTIFRQLFYDIIEKEQSLNAFIGLFLITGAMLDRTADGLREAPPGTSR